MVRGLCARPKEICQQRLAFPSYARGIPCQVHPPDLRLPIRTMPADSTHFQQVIKDPYIFLKVLANVVRINS